MVAAEPAATVICADRRRYVPRRWRKVRLDTLLAERGLFPSRSRAAAAVLAGEVRLGAPARAPHEARPAGGRGRRRGAWPTRPRSRRAAASSSRTRSTRSAFDVAGRRCARRRRLHRRLHRLPAPAGRRARGRARRRLRRARLAASPGRARVTVLERAQRARARRPTICPTGPSSIVVDVSFISLAQGPAGGARRCAADRFDCLAMVKPQFELGRERVGQGRRGARPGRPARGAGRRSRGPPGSSARRCMGFASSGLPGPTGNLETFVWLAEPGRAGASRIVDAAVREVEP